MPMYIQQNQSLFTVLNSLHLMFGNVHVCLCVDIGVIEVSESRAESHSSC